MNIAMQTYLRSLKTYAREIFYLDNEKKNQTGTIALGSLSSIPCFTVSSIAVSNKFNLSKPFPHLAKE